MRAVLSGEALTMRDPPGLKAAAPQDANHFCVGRGLPKHIGTFDQNEDALGELALEKAKRDLVENNSTIFVEPDDLRLISHRPAVATVAGSAR